MGDSASSFQVRVRGFFRFIPEDAEEAEGTEGRPRRGLAGFSAISVSSASYHVNRNPTSKKSRKSAIYTHGGAGRARWLTPGMKRAAGPGKRGARGARPRGHNPGEDGRYSARTSNP